MLLLSSSNLQINSTNNTLPVELISNVLSSHIELFEIDCTAIPGLGITYYLTSEKTSVVYGEINYVSLPIKVSGIKINSDGAPSRPQLDVFNVGDVSGGLIKLIGNLSFLYQDLVGAKVTYIETFSDYLNLGPIRISGPPLKFQIARKLTHNKTLVSFELRSPIDKERAYLPKRQMLKRDFPGLGINKNI